MKAPLNALGPVALSVGKIFTTSQVSFLVKKLLDLVTLLVYAAHCPINLL